MLIRDVIRHVKEYCHDVDAFTGKPIDEATTRDRVTYGNVDQACTGIVTCIWPSAAVIRRADAMGANLIISHEAVFWNHGDRQGPVRGNATFEAKRELLDSWGGAIWRCHDRIHSGVPLDGGGALVDGIFYGFARKMGWTRLRVGDVRRSMDFEIPETTARDLAAAIVTRLGLAGTRLVGRADTPVRRVRIPMHILGGPEDVEADMAMDREGVDCYLAMEMVDFTTCEYLCDASLLGQGKCAIAVGHFNLEEPGMEYMASWLPRALGQGAPWSAFVPVGDAYGFVTGAGVGTRLGTGR